MWVRLHAKIMCILLFFSCPVVEKHPDQTMTVTYDYDGGYSFIDYADNKGALHMEIVWVSLHDNCVFFKTLRPGQKGSYFAGNIFNWILVIEIFYYTPASTKLKGGYTGFTSSVCPSVRLWTESCQQYLLDPFHICTSYKATSQGVWCVKFVSKFKYLKFWQIL